MMALLLSRYKLIKWLLEVFQSINDSKIFNGSGLFMLMYALLIILTTILTSIAIFPIFPIESLAHRDGCHRWHSCPSDDGSYVCGDLGYDDECGGSEEEDTDNGEDIEPANDDTISSNDDNDNGDNDSNGDDTESQSYYKR